MASSSGGSCEKGACSKEAGPSITLTQQMLSAGTGGILTSLLMTPMDVVKIRLQQQARPLADGGCYIYSNGLMDHVCRACADPLDKQPCEWFRRPGHFNGTVDAFVKITRNEGIRSLWSGLSPTLVMAIPATILYYSTYDRLSAYSKKRMPPDGPSWVVPMGCGGLSRAFAVTLVSPIEMLRTKMQSERMKYSDVGVALRTTLQVHGVRGLFLGWTPSLWRDVPFSAIYWTGYEWLRGRALRWRGREHTDFPTSFCCGAAAGTVAATITIPFDVVKTHRQITLGSANAPHPREVTMMKVMRQLVANGGVGALYAGLIPRIAKIAPACAIMIGSYEYFKLYFSRRNAGKE